MDTKKEIIQGTAMSESLVLLMPNKDAPKLDSVKVGDAISINVASFYKDVIPYFGNKMNIIEENDLDNNDFFDLEDIE